ncbi:MAG: DoxX family membrane protein [Candidatus Eremiobacteraeota bacterium]|nr:DoxX family membrane protein [Candidatus Eremiobacteraeota bacterium]
MTSFDLGLLAVRLIIGGAIAAHGAQKLFGWFGGYGIAGTGGFLESIGFRPGRFFAAAAGASEFGGGLLLALGLLTPAGVALVVATMVVAALSVHVKNGFFVSNSGYEYPLVMGVAAATIGFAGPGLLSLDAMLGLTALDTPAIAWIAVGAGILGGLANLALRRAPAAQPTA